MSEKPMTEYMTSREDCAANIRGVCSGCGGKLEPLETVDNARRPTFWAGCVACSQFDNGVSERVFRIARRLVVERHMRPYRIDERERGWLESQTRGAVNIVLEVLYMAKEIGE